MARPIVLVFQEFAQVNVTPDVPDLNCLLVGPAYHIQDYLDDKAASQSAADYGTLNAGLDVATYVAPLVATDAVTIAEPPGNPTGALLDPTSVTVYFDAARVEISADLTTGAAVPLNSNVVTGAGGTTFITDGVKAGDWIIIQDPANPGTVDDLVKRVLAVDSETVLRTTTNFDDPNTCLYRVERDVSNIEVDSSFVTITSNQIVVGGGVTTMLTGEVTARTITYADVYVQYRSLRQNLRGTLTSISSNTDITTNLGKIDARNPLAGVAYAALQNTTTALQVFGVSSDNLAGHNECQDFVEARKDVYAIVPITETLGIITSWQTTVEQLASVTVAEATGVPQKFRVIIGAQDIPTEKILSGPFTAAGSHLSIDAALPGTPIVTADAINVFVDTAATFVTDGVRAGDNLVITNGTGITEVHVGSYVVAEVYDETRLRITTAFAAENTANTATYYYIMRGTGTPVASTTFGPAGTCTAATFSYALDGTVSMTAVAGSATHAGKVMRLTAPAANTGDWLILSCTGVTPGVATVDHPTKTLAVDAGTTAGAIFDTISYGLNVTTSQRRPFRRIRNNAATFQTDLVIAGDFLQVPNPFTGTDYTTLAPYEYEVAYIPSENEIVLAANSDVIADDEAAGDTDLNFRIVRELSRDDQVTELVAISASVNSRRVVLVWPNLATITDLVDGSKTRAVSSTAELADPQPGYYLAGIVGALTAALPSHQGFTNIGVAGVDSVTNSSRYFNDTQLTDLSDGGWFVFAQDTETSAPYCIHQLTTDPDTLDSGEFSLVKNFDFISLFFQDILDDFLGEYNVTEETLGFLNQSLTTGIDLLKLRKFSKIGAPLIAASITSLEVSATSADKVVIAMDVTMPKPLNTIELHLVSQ